MRDGGLRLRALEPEDLEVLYQIENDPSLWDVGLSNVLYSHYALKAFIANTANDIYTDKQLRLVMEFNGRVVGMVDLMAFEPEHLRAEIGVVVLEEFRRQGLATQAVRMLFDYCRSKIHLHQLYVWVTADNTPSRGLFRTLGFSASCIVKDWIFNGEEYKDAILMQFFL